MKKFYAIINAVIQKALIYRINTFGYRAGNFIEIFSQILLWSIIFKNTDMIQGYAYNEMITYVLVGWLFGFISSNYGLESLVSSHIQNGTLNNFLLKPFSYLKYITIYSLGRSAIAMLSGIVIQFTIMSFFYDVLIFSKDPLSYILLFIMLIFAYLIRLFLAILIGLLSFWFTEVDGVYYFLNSMIKIFSGNFFPISLLPAIILKISLVLPFIYTFFFPAQYYLGKFSHSQAFVGILLECFWIILLYVIIKIIWKAGLKKYEGVGI